MWKAFKITVGIMLAFVVVYGAVILLFALSIAAAHADECKVITVWENGKPKTCSVCPAGDGNYIVTCH